MNLKNKRVLLTKVNQIGDVLFTLPLASIIKKLEPSSTVLFLAREYTRSLIEHYIDVDEFVDWGKLSADSEEKAVERLRELKIDVIVNVMANKPSNVVARVAKKAGIPIRIGTLNRLYNLKYCNSFINIRRSKSGLHETQLDMMFAKKLGGKKNYSQQEIIKLHNFKPIEKTADCINLLDQSKFNLILYPKTRGEHIEWPPERFAELITLLPKDKFKIFVTGSEREGDMVREKMISPFPEVVDLCGKISLNDLIQFIYYADGMICCSTGPVHLAAVFGIYTLGLYAPIKPFDASRWGPVGVKAETITIEKDCEGCRDGSRCKCVPAIKALQVLRTIMRWQKEHVAKEV